MMSLDPAAICKMCIRDRPMGNGPFMLDRPWKGKGDIRLTRFDECAYGASLVDGVLLAIHDDTVAAYNHFQAGVLDICDVPVDQLKDADCLLYTSMEAVGRSLGA